MFDGTLGISYLICGLALFLVGAMTPILNRRTNRLLPWNWLGLFAVSRGLYELLSLPALNQVLPGSLEMVRVVLLFLSLIFLLEFGRAGSVTSDGPVPRYLVYVPLACLILLGRILNLAGLAGTVNFSLSIVGGAWAAWALLQAAAKFPKGKDTLTAAGVLMFLLGITSYFIDNSESFKAVVGIPTDLVSALITVGLAGCLLRLCHIAADRVMDRQSQKIYQYLSYGATLGVIFIVVVGLVGSLGVNYLSSKASRETLDNNQKAMHRLLEVINGEMEKADRLVQLMAGSSQLLSALTTSGDSGVVNQANVMLDRFSQTEEGYGICYLMNVSGTTVATSNRNQPDSFLGKNFGFRPYFKQAVLGLQGRYFALGSVQKELGYYTSAPVRNDKGVIVGAAILKRVIRTSEELKSAFDPDSFTFLTDPHGIVVLSNQSSYVYRSVWPLDEAANKEVVDSKQFGAGPFTPILDQLPVDGKNYQIAGRRLTCLSKPTLMEGWTLYHLASIQSVPLYHLMGVAAILAFGFALIGFYVTWDLNSYKAASIVGAEASQGNGHLANRQAEEEVRRGELKYQMLVNHISLLSEMGDLLQGCNNTADAMPVITRYLDRLFPEMSGGVYLATDSEDKFEIAGKWGESPPEERLFIHDDCWALRRGRQYLVEDIGSALLCHHLPPDLPAGYQCWPISAQGKTLGVFHLRQARHLANPLSFSEQQKELTQQLISTVVEQIALTLINLKLRESAARA